MMKQWLARGVTGSSQHVVSPAELELIKKEKANLQLNRLLKATINAAACEVPNCSSSRSINLPASSDNVVLQDLFKQDIGAGRPKRLVTEAEKFRKSLFVELTKSPPLQEMDALKNEVALIKERVATWFQQVNASSASSVNEEDQVRVAPDAAPKDSSTNLNLWSHVPSRIVIQFLCHKWAALTGEHADFVTATELGARLQQSFEKSVAMSTLCLWLDKEKKAYLSWKNNEYKVGDLKPITSKGEGLLPLLATASAAEKAENLIDEELCRAREQGNMVFTQKMRAVLKRECFAL